MTKQPLFESVRSLIPAIRKGYRLKWLGIHGASHWARVLVNGNQLCEITGADLAIVTMFSIFHDARREDDLYDPTHGKRGGELALCLLGKNSAWDETSLAILGEACLKHTAVKHHENVTIQTCWDADRLDLPRIGAVVDSDYLGSWACQREDVIQAATIRAKEKQFPHAYVFS